MSSVHEIFDSVQSFSILAGLVFFVWDRLRLAGELKGQFEKLSTAVESLAKEVGRLSTRQAATDEAFRIYRELKD